MTSGSLSLAVITLNEEKKLADCLNSVPFAHEKIVVDSGSKDRTCDIAASLGAKVLVRSFDDFSSQKNYAISKTTGEWVLLLDADEKLSEGLGREVLAVTADPSSKDGYYLKRHNILFGGPMRFGSNADDWQLRLIRRQKGVFEGNVHERIVLNGQAGRLKHPLLHTSYQTLSEYQSKFPQFCSMDAERMYREGKRPHVYHLFLKPLAHFAYFYIVKLGFLDGARGLLYHVLSVRYLYVKYWKARRLFIGQRRSS